ADAGSVVSGADADRSLARVHPPHQPAVPRNHEADFAAAAGAAAEEVTVARQWAAGREGDDQGLAEEAGGRGEAGRAGVTLPGELTEGGVERGDVGPGDIGEAAGVGAADRFAGEGR